MARPTSCTEDVIKQAWHYVNNWKEYGRAIPSHVALCQAINRSRAAVYRWATLPENPFSEILEAINELQEMELLDKGLTGEWNSNIVKLALGKQGYHDRKDVNVNDKRDSQHRTGEARNQRIAELARRRGAGTDEAPVTH